MLPIPERAKASIQAGHLIEAIKIVREEQGLDLKEAKDAVDAYVQGNSGGTPTPRQPAELSLKAISFLMEGDRIAAIQSVHKAQGLQLKDAKDLVEAYIASHPDLREKFDAQAAGLKRKAVTWLVILLGAAAIMFLTRHNG